MKLRSLLLASAAVIVAAPAFAADLDYVPPAGDPVYTPAPMSVVGHLELGLGLTSIDTPAGDDDFGLFNGFGRVNIPFGGTWNLEVETGGVAVFEDGDSVSGIGAYGHLWTGFGGGRVGALAGVEYSTGGFETTGVVGLEGEVDLNALTLGAQGTYRFGDDDFEAWGLRGWADYYFTPNTKVGLDLAWSNFDFDFGDSDVWSVGLGAEHRFDNTPFSAFADVAYTDYDHGADGWSGMIGARIFLDNPGTTLQDHDRQVPFDVKPVGLFGGGFGSAIE